MMTRYDFDDPYTWAVVRYFDCEIDVYQMKDGVTYVQTVGCMDAESLALDEELLANGYSPIEEGWEDGMGNPMRPAEFGRVVEGC